MPIKQQFDSPDDQWYLQEHAAAAAARIAAAKSSNPETTAPTSPSPEPKDKPTSLTAADVLHLAHDGHDEVLPQLKGLLNKHPEICDEYDLIKVVKRIWVDRIAERDLVMGETLKRQIEKLQKDLSGPTPSPLEKLLVDHVVVSWLAVQYASLVDDPAGEQNVQTARQRMLWSEIAEKRFTRVCKTLAQVRRLSARWVRTTLTSVATAARSRVAEATPIVPADPSTQPVAEASAGGESSNTAAPNAACQDRPRDETTSQL